MSDQQLAAEAMGHAACTEANAGNLYARSSFESSYAVPPLALSQACCTVALPSTSSVKLEADAAARERPSVR